MGDEEHRHALRGFKLGKQLQDLRLHGDIERRGRLVGNQQLRLVGKRHGDHDALALSAGKLVREGRQALFRFANADFVQKFQRPRPCSLLPMPWCIFRISPICRSTLCSGLSDVIGS